MMKQRKGLMDHRQSELKRTSSWLRWAQPKTSPFLLAATVDNHLQNFAPCTAEKIRNNIYVYNVITGVESVHEVVIPRRHLKWRKPI